MPNNAGAHYEFHWPITQRHPVLSEAMAIAMDYLEQTGIAERITNTEALVAAEILTSWEKGIRHRIALSNRAIDAAEKLAA